MTNDYDYNEDQVVKLGITHKSDFAVQPHAGKQLGNSKKVTLNEMSVGVSVGNSLEH